MEKKFNQIKKCQICAEDSTNVCFQCKMYFCDGCFKLIHDFKNNSLHKKENIDPFVPIDFKCPNHPESPLNLFCVDDNGKLYLYFII